MENKNLTDADIKARAERLNQLKTITEGRREQCADNISKAKEKEREATTVLREVEKLEPRPDIQNANSKGIEKGKGITNA